jgi:hypothetical protein
MATIAVECPRSFFTVMIFTLRSHRRDAKSGRVGLAGRQTYLPFCVPLRNSIRVTHKATHGNNFFGVL